MNRRFYLNFFVLLLIFISYNSHAELIKRDLIINNSDNEIKIFNVEIADTEYSRNKGLMWREHIPNGTGMLFVWESEAYRNFWMKSYVKNENARDDGTGFTFAMKAAQRGDVTILLWLSTHNANFNLFSINDGFDALLYATKQGSLSCLRLLNKQHVDLNYTAFDGIFFLCCSLF